MSEVDFPAFMRRFFPTFLLGFFAALIAVTMAVTLWADSHWRNAPDNGSWSVVLCGALVLLLCVGHFVMIRGMRWGFWVVLPVLLAALLMGLSLLGSGLPALLLAFTLALPLLALLIFNSPRHREMRRQLLVLRQQRAGLQDR